MILQPSKHLPRQWGSHLSPVQVTVVYEDLEAGIRAKALMDCVQTGLELPAKLKVDLWRFDWLSELSMRNMALNIAKSSTLVLVSASTNNPIPTEMDRWMRVWMQSREEQLSAIVLLAMQESRSVGFHPLQETLRRVAEHKQVEFYCEFFKPSHAEPQPASAYRGEYSQMSRSRHEQHAIVPPLITDFRSSQPVSAFQ